MIRAFSALDHLVCIAHTPRAAGSPAETAARSYCAGVLRDAGFDVREHVFEYSAFPGRYATSAVGGASTLLLLCAALSASVGRPGRAAALLALGGAALAAGALWTARWGVLDMPWMRRRGVNLEAARGADLPGVWLVAHVDSKSQPIPMLIRVGAITLHAVTWLVVFLLCATEWLGRSTAVSWPGVAAASLATGLPIVVSVVGNRSPGAVDNASGVVAVLLAAAMLPREVSIGVLLTSAEELGLAGARAWARNHQPATALNCDGIDDGGELLCMYSGRRPNRLVAAYERAAAAEGKRLRVRRLLPGVLVDGVAFADAGWAVLTLSRGTIGTLSRVHTRRDSLGALTGAGVDDAVPVLTRVARDLC